MICLIYIYIELHCNYIILVVHIWDEQSRRIEERCQGSSNSFHPQLVRKTVRELASYADTTKRHLDEGKTQVMWILFISPCQNYLYTKKACCDKYDKLNALNRTLMLWRQVGVVMEVLPSGNLRIQCGGSLSGGSGNPLVASFPVLLSR